uniref:Uncharacterized protein n=1 Tax=Arundo donax TaxID=35708 RepID=A0A0A9DLF7_ARUDO
MHVVTALALMLDKFNKRRLVAVVKMLPIVSQDLFRMISAWSISIVSVLHETSIVSQDHSEMLSILSDISEMVSTVSEVISEMQPTVP